MNAQKKKKVPPTRHRVSKVKRLKVASTYNIHICSLSGKMGKEKSRLAALTREAGQLSLSAFFEPIRRRGRPKKMTKKRRRATSNSSNAPKEKKADCTRIY